MTTVKPLLLVEDEDELRRSIQFTLRRTGFQVIAFKDPLEAIGEISCLKGGASPFLVVTDVRMPRMSGVTFIEKLREKGIDSPVLVITGQASPAERSRLRQLKVLRILNKPFNLEELVEEVHRASGKAPEAD